MKEIIERISDKKEYIQCKDRAKQIEEAILGNIWPCNERDVQFKL